MVRAGAILASLAGVACSGLLDVASPSRVPASTLDSPQLAGMLVRSAIGDFECVFGNYVATSALVTDEFSASSASAQTGLDRRIPNLDQSGGCAQLSSTAAAATWVGLATARYQADDTFVRLANEPQTDSMPRWRATLAAYAGYAYTIIGEGYCTAAFDDGPELQPLQVLQIASQRFDSAIALAQAPGNSDILNFARVGHARVLLDLGMLPEAAAEAKLVSPNFRRDATYSSDSPRRQNQVWVWNGGVAWATVDARFRNLTVGGVADPRVSVIDAGKNGPGGKRLWLANRYSSDASPIPIATWEEAQLIVGEAEGGQSAVAVVNALRSKAGLPATFASTDPVAIRDTLREERRRQLFLQGHRLNDMLRFLIPFDTGINAYGQTYSTMTCFPLPRVETDNNPNIQR